MTYERRIAAMLGPFVNAWGTAIRTQTESNSSAVQSDAGAPNKHKKAPSFEKRIRDICL